MNKNIAMKWVAALRSNRYFKGSGQLRDSESSSFCCLGVLCDLHRLSRVKASGKWNNDEYLDENEAVPGTVMKWAGISDNIGTPRTGLVIDLYPSLADANDDHISFYALADYIEANHETL